MSNTRWLFFLFLTFFPVYSFLLFAGEFYVIVVIL